MLLKDMQQGELDDVVVIDENTGMDVTISNTA